MLGRRLARDLRLGGCAVFGLARQPLAEEPDGQDWLPLSGDVRDPGSALRAVQLSDPDLIFHLSAAQAGATQKPLPRTLYETNLAGTLNLLLAAVEAAPRARLIVVGSGVEYGPQPDPRGRRRLRETDPPRPATPYGASKHAATQAALAMAAAHDLDLTVVRLFNLLGPSRQSAGAPAWFARQVAEMEAGQRPPVLTCRNLASVRDFLDVRDASRALCLLGESAPQHRLYNLCSGQGSSLRTLVDHLCRLSRLPASAIAVAEEGGGADRLVGDPGRLQRETGWAPAVPLTDALQALLDHWRSSAVPR